MSESSSPQQHPAAEAEAEYVRIPGVRFVPSDQELILYYLRAKLRGDDLPTDLVKEANVYGEHPKELTSRLGRSVEGFWYVFSKRERKYPKGKRPSRSTGTDGRWKPVGQNEPVLLGADKKNIIGRKCGLGYEVFVHDDDQSHGSKPSRPRLEKTEWKMCEFVAEGTNKPISSTPAMMELNDWVLCKITRKAGEILEEEYGEQATLVDEPYEDEQLQNTTPPDPSQQAQVQMQDLLLLEDGVNGSDGAEVGAEGFEADVEPPCDGDCLTDVQFVDYHHPELWNECGEDFYHGQWNVHGNQFGATIADPDPTVNQLGVPADPDSTASPIELPSDPQSWDIASSLLFPDDSHELVKDEIEKANDDSHKLVMDEVVKANDDIGKDNAAANKTPAPANAQSECQT